MTSFPLVLLTAATLFEQSVVRVLTRDFPHAQFVLVRVDTKEVLGQRWAEAGPIPLGSLVKPFTAFAIGSKPGQARCNPQQCWLPAGHGRIGLVEALAESCNSFFLQQVARISAEDLQQVLRRFHLAGPATDSPAAFIGIGTDWKIIPADMARAYALLVDALANGAVLHGMRLAARSGTAKLLNGAAAAKTGTAPCSHRQKAPGDGYVAMLYPAEAPKYVLLVQIHGVSGAEATRTAVKMLDVLRRGA